MNTAPRLVDLPPPPAGKSGWPWTEASPWPPPTLPRGAPWPPISIVTPSFNQGEFLEATIRSVLLQGYPSLEYIVIDGASSDSSKPIIRKYEPWLTYWRSAPDRGQSHAINEGFREATGDIYTWLNSDDRYLPGTLVAVAESASANPDAGAMAGAGDRIDSFGNVLFTRRPPPLSFEAMLQWHDGYLPQASCFFRREAWERCGPLDENLHFQMDYDLWLKIARCFEFVEVPRTLSQDTLHGEAKTVSAQWAAKRLAERWIVLARYSEEHARREMAATLDMHLKVVGPLNKMASMPVLRRFRPLVRNLLRTHVAERER